MEIVVGLVGESRIDKIKCGGTHRLHRILFVLPFPAEDGGQGLVGAGLAVTKQRLPSARHSET